MIALSIDKKPYYISFAVFDFEKRTLKKWGTIYFVEKSESERVNEIWVAIEELLNEVNPNILLTQWIDLERTTKKDLGPITQIKTALRKLCFDRNIIYNEFKTLGWEKKITNQTKPSKKSKLAIAKEYSPLIDSIGVANAIILGEGVVWNRLQIGRD